MARVVTLKINDQDVTGRDDESILDIARQHGIFIPTLCHLDGLYDIGACRLCLVEVKGFRKLTPACATYPTEGMEVQTDSERLVAYRRTIIEMLFSEGNHICSVCVSNGHCDLQYLASRLGVDHIRVPHLNPKRNVDASHARFALDENRCILCTRCVRVCEQIEGAQTWGTMDRGIMSRVITDMDQPWGDSQTCTSCGKCVQVCPTGAIFEKGRAVSEMIKRREFLPYLASMRNGKNGHGER
ncbi:MAG: bidirectional hydrogenase complex protein HoxU [Anaerolineae bacterium]|nr:bidirectional hydrogenase complex protein HoxU [Anaerolineae bacterium]